jgi:hypothetical protein
VVSITLSLIVWLYKALEFGFRNIPNRGESETPPPRWRRGDPAGQDERELDESRFGFIGPVHDPTGFEGDV